MSIQPVSVTYLAFQFNKMLDRGIQLSMTATKDHITDRSLFAWLQSDFAEVSLGNLNEAEKSELQDFFDGLLQSVNENRKYGVVNNGFALLTAYCVDWIQQNLLDL